MHLDSLTLRHFKCFTECNLSLGKITLLLGANSTGKSSLLNGLLGALQSDLFPLALSANGSLVNLGDFGSIAFGHTRESTIEVGLTFQGHSLGSVDMKGAFRRSTRTGMPECAAASIQDSSFSVDVSSADKKFRAEWKYNADRDSFRRNMLASEESRTFFQALGRLMTESRRAKSKAPAADPDDPPIDPLALPPPSGRLTFGRPSDFFARLAQPRYMLLGSHLGSLSATISDFKRQFNYVGSFRLEPQRSYYQVSRGNLKVERDGKNYIEQIATWQEQRSTELSQLKRAVRALKLVSSVRASRMRSGLFEILVQPQGSRLSVSLADVGFGIGQVLPILVADLQLPRGGTLALSQPEIHLHPSAQADLAEYFVKRASGTKRRYLIETHSEYFINRLRALVAQGALSPDDLSVVYLTNDGNRSTVHGLKFTTAGRVEGAPKEFFQTYMLDVMSIAEHAHA